MKTFKHRDQCNDVVTKINMKLKSNIRTDSF